MKGDIFFTENVNMLNRRMKNIKKTLEWLIFAELVLLFAGCYVPSPLYGTWADNNGNKISFVSDGTFVATITDLNTKEKTVTQGDYTVIDNVICFSTTDGISINTEWDIRGSMLYITWTKGGITNVMTLYHISK